MILKGVKESLLGYFIQASWIEKAGIWDFMIGTWNGMGMEFPKGIARSLQETE